MNLPRQGGWANFPLLDSADTNFTTEFTAEKKDTKFTAEFTVEKKGFEFYDGIYRKKGYTNFTTNLRKKRI